MSGFVQWNDFGRRDTIHIVSSANHENKMNNQTVDDGFWNSDLEVIEASFLARGERITHLKTIHMDDLVPSQGSVLLDQVINMDAVVPTPSVFHRLYYRIFS